MRKLELQSFRQWLVDNQDNNVGVVFDNCNCPIARYMQDVHNVRTSVDGYAIRDLDNACAEDMEQWATRFVRWLDNEHNHYISVSGKEALKDLEASIAYWAKLAGEKGR